MAEKRKVRCLDCGAMWTEVYPDGVDESTESFSDLNDPKPCKCKSQYEFVDEEAFDWSLLRTHYTEAPQATREAAIYRAFNQYVRGNTMDEMSTPEAEGMYNTFRAGWIVCEGYLRPVTRHKATR